MRTGAALRFNAAAACGGFRDTSLNSEVKKQVSLTYLKHYGHPGHGVNVRDSPGVVGILSTVARIVLVRPPVKET